MADIDARLMNDELRVFLYLAAQVVLVGAAGLLGWVAGGRGRPRWVWGGLVVAAGLALVAGGRTLFTVADARADVHARQEGRLPGPFLPADRADTHLAYLSRCEMTAWTLLAVAPLVGGVGFWFGRRAGRTLDRTQGEG